MEYQKRTFTLFVQIKCQHEAFGAMFPGNEVAKQYTMGKEKVSYFVLYGIASVLKEGLITTVNKSPFYSIGFDKSLNHISQDNQMDIHVRFWDSEKSQAEIDSLHRCSSRRPSLKICDRIFCMVL